MSIEKNGSSLSQSVVHALLGKIFSGELKVGDRLPPERELAEQMCVIRTGDEALSARLARESVVQGISVIETCYDWSKKDDTL